MLSCRAAPSLIPSLIASRIPNAVVSPSYSGISRRRDNAVPPKRGVPRALSDASGGGLKPRDAMGSRDNTRSLSSGSSSADGATGGGGEGFILGRGPPGAWDSGGVGRMVVRRFSAPGEEGDSWVMWYEGWAEGRGDSAEAKPEAEGETSSGVPVESGAECAPSYAGLALSANGLLWTRGSSSVETDSRGAGGAGLVLRTSNNWWSFDTRGVRPSDVIMMSSPKVRASGGVLWMYYEGISHEELELPGCLPEEQKRHILAAAGHRGGPLLRSRPGLAMSNDGRNWASIEGDHHSGALLDVGAEGEWDSWLMGGPHVVFHAAGDLRMYYHALDPSTWRFSIGLARSRDGIKWFKMGKVLEAPEGLGCVNAQVVGGRKELGLQEEGGYAMLYERVGEGGESSICVAHSVNGLTQWEHRGVLLQPQAEQEGVWDGVSVGSPCLVDMGEGTLRLYYLGRARDGAQAVGLAELEEGSHIFSRHGSLGVYMSL